MIGLLEPKFIWKRNSFCAAQAVALSVFLIAGCGSKNDAINQAEKQDAINVIPVPSLAETKAIAQEGFVFGLPTVMYYMSAFKLLVNILFVSI
jgi:hypothetical protein